MITETAPNSQIYAIQGFSPLKLSLLYDHYVQLISVSTVGAFVLSFYLYFSSFSSKDLILAKGGNTGNAVYDFFIGKYRHLCSFILLFPIDLPSFFHSFFFISISCTHSLIHWFSEFVSLLPPSTPCHKLDFTPSWQFYHHDTAFFFTQPCTLSLTHSPRNIVCLALPCPALPCPALPCLTFPYLTLPFLHVPQGVNWTPV